MLGRRPNIENTFTSATIEVAANQKVISTGPYAPVRHPMYASALLYLMGTPLAPRLVLGARRTRIYDGISDMAAR
jgi:protein-S-isoprenylcysteine O-methyltransferase Ste14